MGRHVVESASSRARFLAAGHRGSLRALSALAVVSTGGVASCYSTGDGSPPPLNEFYYPVGLQVSAGGTVLYAVNSDFDLQFNGGTLQAYDLRLIRQHPLLTTA